VPQLEHAAAPRSWPAITTHNHDNHGIRTEQWRFIRYADGAEELYDMHADPHEWHNLARDPGHQAMCSELSRWIPSPSVQPAPGSAHRILTYQQGVATWEEKIIVPNEPIPEIVELIK
jgi:hypothetical protein